MYKKSSFPIILFFIALISCPISAQNKTARVYVKTPAFVFTAGTHRIIANDYPYSCWPYLYFPIRIRYHHHYYYRHPVYYHYWYYHGRHYRKYGHRRH